MVEAWKEPEEVQLFVLPLKAYTQNYNFGTSIPRGRDLEKAALSEFLKDRHPLKTLQKDVHGKPHFGDGHPHFNYSHSQTHLFWGENPHFPMGVDIETLRPQLQRVAHKYCNPEELSYTDSGTKTRLLLAIWSAKESMFKAYGKGVVDFREDMHIDRFEDAENGILRGYFKTGNSRRLNIYYRRFNNSICTWTLWD